MITQNVKKLLLMTMALFLLSLTATLTSGTSSLAETKTPEITAENLFEAQYVNGVYTITKFKGQNITEIVVPASIDGRKVQAIGAYAFNGAGNIHSLYLPDSLEIIGENAFYNCVKLESIVLPPNLKEIGLKAFHSAGLKNITFNNKLETIGDYAFAYTSLEKITIPNNVKSIKERAFFSCDH